MSLSAREAAMSVVRRLRDAGHEAVFAGGCVRDELLGLSPKDYDVATDATPQRVAELFDGSREVGKSFGVMHVRPARWRGPSIEVATFRREGAYSDKRRPDAVEFTDARQDAHRRDFTINALFIDPLDTSERIQGRVIDYVGGLDDLKHGVVRAVGDPDARLSEDHLRALRAVRFAARLAFELEPATAAAVGRHARELAGVSRERVGDEMRRMLANPRRLRALGLIHELGLDASVLNEPALGVIELPTVRGLPESAGVETAVAAWAIDRAAVAGRLDVGAIAILASRVPTAWRRALCLSNDERDRVRATLELVGAIEGSWAGWRVAARKRAAARAEFAAALAIVATRDAGLAGAVGHEVRELSGQNGGLAPERLVTGDDLVAAGLAPGPSFARVLEGVYDAQLEGRVRDRAGALEAALRQAAGLGNGPGDSRESE